MTQIVTTTFIYRVVNLWKTLRIKDDQYKMWGYCVIEKE